MSFERCPERDDNCTCVHVRVHSHGRVSSDPVSLERSRSTALVSFERSLEVVVREVVVREVVAWRFWRTPLWGAPCGFSLLILSFSSLRSFHMELL
jgi:hypothetical protein